MSRRLYDDGVLVQEWDDATRTYRRWNTAGVLLEERTYTAAELEPVTAWVDGVRDGSNRDEVMFRLQSALGINHEELDADVAILNGAQAIAYGADIANLAQGAAAIKQLARGIEALTNHEIHTKWELNGLIRLAIAKLDNISETGELF